MGTLTWANTYVPGTKTQNFIVTFAGRLGQLELFQLFQIRLESKLVPVSILKFELPNSRKLENKLNSELE